MNLMTLLARAEEIAATIINITAQLNALHGHKAETAHWIQQLQAKDDATQVEMPDESVVG